MAQNFARCNSSLHLIENLIFQDKSNTYSLMAFDGFLDFFLLFSLKCNYEVVICKWDEQLKGSVFKFHEKIYQEWQTLDQILVFNSIEAVL